MTLEDHIRMEAMEAALPVKQVGFRRRVSEIPYTPRPPFESPSDSRYSSAAESSSSDSSVDADWAGIMNVARNGDERVVVVIATSRGGRAETRRDTSRVAHTVEGTVRRFVSEV